MTHRDVILRLDRSIQEKEEDSLGAAVKPRDDILSKLSAENTFAAASKHDALLEHLIYHP